MGQCTAKSKRSGERCKGKSLRGMEVCRMHGGKSRRGIAHPNFQHGKYSQDIPTRLAARYQQALHDDRLLELTDEIALVDVRLAELVRQLDERDAGVLWAALRKSWTEVQAARRSGDTAAIAEALNAHGALIAAGASVQLKWAEITDLQRHRAGLVRQQGKREMELQQMIPAGQAMVMIGRIVDVVRRNVSDQQALAAIAAEVRQLLADEGSRQLGPGDPDE